MTITICLGSACHVKGSHFVLEGLCATIGDQLYSVSPDTTKDFFESEVLAKL